MLSDKLRAALLIPSGSQWHKWRLLGKATFVSYAVGVIGVVFTIGWSIYTAPHAPPPKAYELTDAKSAKFRQVLEVTPNMKVDTLRIGCVNWSEESCIAAGKIATLLSEAGWAIQGNQVFRVDTKVPVEGVAITARDADLMSMPEQPIHKGRWALVDTSTELIESAFRIIDVPVRAASDPTLPDDKTIGVYFGPNTNAYSTIAAAQKEEGAQLMEFVKTGLVIEQECATESSASCSTDRTPWESQVSSYLTDEKFSADEIRLWTKYSVYGVAGPKQGLDVEINILAGLFLMRAGRMEPPL